MNLSGDSPAVRVTVLVMLDGLDLGGITSK